MNDPFHKRPTGRNVNAYPLRLGGFAPERLVVVQEGRPQLEYLPQHHVGAEVQVHARRENLGSRT